ncbi:MAG: hypothetical protein PHX30_04180 [Candidatus Pacebacteria bacterium]|nr:hypothetical protein [Candidatus Paceibacterota bacterium]
MTVIGPIISGILSEGRKIRNVTDIGTAQGHIFLGIAKSISAVYSDAHFIGIDKKHGLSDGVLAAGIITPQKGNYLKLGIKDSSIDILTLIYIAQSMNGENQHSLMDWAVSKVVPGGDIVFVDVCKRGGFRYWIDWLKHHIYNGLASYNIKYEGEWMDYVSAWEDLEIVYIYDLPDRSVVIHARKRKNE